MAELRPFTRLTVMISELNGNRVEDLADSKKCDLAHHAAQLQREFGETPQKGIADQIREQSQSLLHWLGSGDSVRAEAERRSLLSSCRTLKDII